MNFPPGKTKGEGQGIIPTVKKYRPGGSCAECKRLKIKCTKSAQDAFPCDSCIRRGCQAICPGGSLTSGKTGGRFVLANTEELHKKILELSSRVRELEDALQELQAASSTESHPLLRRDLLLVKAPLESQTVLAEGEGPSEDPESLDAFGSLSLRRRGRSNFHAQTAGSWYLLQNEDPEPAAPQEDVTHENCLLPVDVLYASHTFPLSTLQDTRHDLRTRIHQFIPDREMAARLVDNYFNGISWMYDPISRPSFDEAIFNAVYTSYFPLVPDCDVTILSVFFMVIAIGTLLDLNVPNYSPQATRYYQLSRAALSVDLVLDEPSIATIQSLQLMGLFLHMSDSKGGFGTSWALMGLTSKLAVGIGLHRDSTKWKLGSEDEVRRQLFWELFTYDTWQSLPCGRPPSFQRLSVDSKMPFAEILAPDARFDNPGTTFKAWKHRFCYERISPMVEQSFGPRTPAYATVLLLDRKIRDDPVPQVLQLGSNSITATLPTDHANTSLAMQRYTVLCVREISLLLMHRPFFAQAAMEKAPLDTKFAPSILAVYRSSCTIIAGVRALYDQQPRLSPRIWFFWAHVFSATICLGGLVARCPSLSLAPSALAQVDSACELFSKVKESNRASKSLPSMLKLRDKAHLALAQFCAGKKTPLSESQQPDELSALVGETRLVVHRTQLLSPAQSICGSASSPDAQSANAFFTGAVHNARVSLPEGLTSYTDQGSTNYSFVDQVIPSYQVPYHTNTYSDYRHPEQPTPAPLSHAMQEEYYYLSEYAPQHPEQQMFEQSRRDGTWQNFMTQLDMDFPSLQP